MSGQQIRTGFPLIDRFMSNSVKDETAAVGNFTEPLDGEYWGCKPSAFWDKGH